MKMEEKKIESVSTGDESAVGFWSLMAVIMVSIVMCMAFTKIRRKKKERLGSHISVQKKV